MGKFLYLAEKRSIYIVQQTIGRQKEYENFEQ